MNYAQRTFETATRTGALKEIDRCEGWQWNEPELNDQIETDSLVTEKYNKITGWIPPQFHPEDDLLKIPYG
jgi:hypothetical protein